MNNQNQEQPSENISEINTGHKKTNSNFVTHPQNMFNDPTIKQITSEIAHQSNVSPQEVQQHLLGDFDGKPYTFTPADYRRINRMLHQDDDCCDKCIDNYRIL